MIILDVVVATLLLATIFYAWKLSRSISSFKESRKEMAEFINQFGSAIVQAEDSITKLKTLNKEIDSDMRVNIERARFLANDLSFLIHKGNDVANKLENNFDVPKTANVKKSTVAANEFVNRAEKINSSLATSAATSVKPQNKALASDNPITKKLAVQEALANLQRAASVHKGPLMKIQAQQQATRIAQNNVNPAAKEKRLFDLLKFGKQLEIQK